MNVQLSPQRTSHADVSIEQIADRIITSGRITRADERFFMRAALSGNPLSAHEMGQIKRVVDRLHMGLLRVVE
jgi:hypothetical protein